MRRKIMIIIKSLCDAILWGQPKIKIKTLILHYSINSFWNWSQPKYEEQI